MMRVRTRITLFATATLLASAAQAVAAGSIMPWEQPLRQILQSIEGPVTKVIAVIVIIVTGLSIAFGGLSIAFAASSFVSRRSSQR